MTREHDESCLDKPWLAPGVVFWCRIDLDDENWAMMFCPAINEAHKMDRLLDEFFSAVFGEADPRYISKKNIARMVEQISMFPPAEREDRFDILEGVCAASHIRWNLDAWARQEGRKPPPEPRYTEERRSSDEPSPLQVIPAEFTARLLWTIKVAYSRAASGNWDAFARVPDRIKGDDMPTEVKQQLYDIMGEGDEGDPETD